MLMSKQMPNGLKQPVGDVTKKHLLRYSRTWGTHPYVRIRVCFIGELPSLKLTFSPLEMDGWKMSFLLGWPIFRGYVCFREGISSISGWWSETFVYFHPDPWGNDPI